MAAAATVGCSFCLDFGYFMVHNKGLDEAAQVAENQTGGHFDSQIQDRKSVV